MKNFLKPIAWAFILFTSANNLVNAQSLNVVANDEDGKMVAETPVTNESVIRFSNAGIEVYTDDVLVTTIPYTGVETLTFQYATSFVKSISTDSSLRLQENPVGDYLNILGYEGEPLSLYVFDLKGSLKVQNENWDGQRVYVGSLAPGFYIVNLNNNSIKFIKK